MRTFTAFVLLGLLTASSAASAQSTDYDIPAHVARVEGRAVIERPGLTPANAESGGEVLERNLTLTEGDRIRTLAGRVEILFSDGTLLHLDRNTVIDFQTEDFVRVMEGRARWFVSRAARSAMRVDTPAATLELEPGGDYRVAVAPNGDAELAVLRGEGALFNDQGDTRLRAGERAVAAVGRAPSQAFYANAASWDDFDRWSDAQHRAHLSAISTRYLPDEMDPYGYVFDSYGSWRSHPTHGYVWYPVVSAGWQPYSHGRWHSYPRYGWTWIGRDPWDWPTHHFGRWGFSAGVWFWIPGRRWAPAWVAWASSPGYVGWSPLGWNDHPIYGLNVYSPYSSGYPWCGWTFIRERHFGGYVAPGQTVIGVGVNVIARSGIRPVDSSPIPSRAIPRTGVPSGTAIPRGTAIARPGGGGSSGSNPGGLAGVPTTRPRRIPTETIRSGGESGTSDRRVPVARTPGESTRTPFEPSRKPSDTAGSREPREGSTPAGTARPRGGAASGGSNETPQPAQPPAAGRPVRRPSGGGAPEASSVSSPYSVPQPRARERNDSRPEAPGGWRAPESREPFREARPRPADRGYEAPAPAQPRERTHEAPAPPPARERASSRERSSSPGSRAPAARPQPSSSGGGGQERSRGGSSSSGGDRQAQRRPRGGG